MLRLRGHGPEVARPAVTVARHIEVRRYARARDREFRSALDAAIDYVTTGEARDIWPTRWFDVAWYRETYGGGLPEGRNLFDHFVRRGAPDGLSPNAACWTPPEYPFRAPGAAGITAETAGIDVRLIRAHFDADWYYRQTPELHAFDGDPLDHFLRFGARQCRWPHPLFNSHWYLERYAFVRTSGQNPLLHYIGTGRHAGCLPNPEGELPLEWPRGEEPTVGRFDAQFRLRDLAAMAADPAHSVPPVGGAGTLPPDPGPDVEVLSFDVWDTLLRRDCNPDEIKLRTVRYLQVVHGRRLRPVFRDPAACYRARIHAEGEAAPNGDWEFELGRALTGWVRKVFEPGELGPDTARNLAQELLAHEVETEMRSVRADGPMRDYLARQEGTTRVFMSDFYMGEAPLRRILAAGGIDERLLVAGFASCDTLKNKRSGTLYAEAAERLSVAPGRIMHIGDNPEADVARAREQGVQAAEYRDKAEAARQDWYGTAMRALLEGDAEPHLARLSAIAERAAARLARPGDQAAQLRALGARLAPVLLGSGLWTIEHALHHGAGRVWFFTREGTFLKRVYDRLTECRPYGTEPPPSALLHVSRRATFAASLEEVGTVEMMRLWRLYSVQSPRGLARSLTLDEALVARRCRAVGLDYGESIRHLWEEERIHALFADPEFAAHATEVLAARRAELTGYLGGVGFGEAARETIVDIGWRGTIQDNITRATGVPITGLYLGLFGFINEQPEGSAKLGYLFDENENRNLLQNQEVAPLEVICNALGGSVMGYRIRADGTAEPVCETHPPEEASITATSLEVQAGVLEALPALMDHVERHGLRAQDLTPLALGLARAVLADPPACLADAFFALEHNETFGTGEIQRIGGHAAFRDDLPGHAAGQGTATLHAQLGKALDLSRWREGIVRRSEVRRWTASRTEACRALPGEFTAPYLRPERLGRMVFVCPAPIRGSGGHRTIYAVARRFIELGFPIHILLEQEGEGTGVVRDLLGTGACSIEVGWATAEGIEAVFATTPRSAHFIARHFAHVPHRFYLAQDFEAAFNPVGDAYVMAENSYALGLTPLAIGAWLPHVLGRAYGIGVFANGLGHDPHVYHPRPGIPREKAVAVLWQPEKPRRAMTLALDALRLVKAAEPDTRLYLYGSDRQPPADLDCRHLGLVTDLGAIGDLYARCRAGLCLSLTNPSRIPVELMACGAVPVDVYRYNTLFDYAGGTALLAYQNAESLAAALLRLLREDGHFEVRSRACIDFAADRTSRWEMDTIQNTILAQLSGRPFVPETPMPIYNDPALVVGGDAEAAFCRHQAGLAGLEGRDRAGVFAAAE